MTKKLKINKTEINNTRCHLVLLISVLLIFNFFVIPTQIQFLFYLNDVDKKNYGATQVIPGSHKINRYPQKKDRNKAKQILGKAGDFFAIDSSLWHGSSVKKNNTQRTLVTLSYSRWNIRQSYAIPYGINKYKPDNFNQKQKYLLGYFNYPEKTEKERTRMRGLLPKL